MAPRASFPSAQHDSLPQVSQSTPIQSTELIQLELEDILVGLYDDDEKLDAQIVQELMSNASGLDFDYDCDSQIKCRRISDEKYEDDDCMDEDTNSTSAPMKSDSDNVRNQGTQQSGFPRSSRVEGQDTFYTYSVLTKTKWGNLRGSDLGIMQKVAGTMWYGYPTIEQEWI